MSSAGWADSLAAGIGAIAAGADFDDVVSNVVKESVLNLIPLYSIGQVMVAVAGAIKALLGVEKDPPILGLILDEDAVEKRGPAWALGRVARAAVQRAAGFARYQDVATATSGPLSGTIFGTGTLSIHKDNFHLWSWLIDLQDRLIDAFRASGVEGIKLELKTSAVSLQAFHAAVALQAWAESTVEIVPAKYQSPLTGWVLTGPTAVSYATGQVYEVAVRLGQLPFTDTYFLGAERKVLKGKWGLFKRLGLPSYQVYEKAILDGQGASVAPLDEVFPGADAANVLPIEGFEDMAAPGSAGAAAAGAASQSSGAQGPAASLTATKASADARQVAALPVAVGVGSLALLLAFL